ncbi:MAG: PAS-domain containing protein [Rhodobacteraceae bacterium]|nr:PAS-domain containing protein [Paracoccaceae bacterium]
MGATSVLAALGGLVLLTVLQKREDAGKARSIFQEGEDATVFLFDGEVLVDATPSAYRLLAGSRFDDQPWFALMERLSTRFTDLAARLADVEMLGSLALTGSMRGDSRPIALRAEMRGGLMKIALVTPGREVATHGGDLLTVHALDCELQDLRDASNAAPFPIWRALPDGDIIWANTAYMNYLSAVPRAADVAEWPLRALFDLTPAKGDAKGAPLRRTGPDGKGWFEITSRSVDEGQVHYALPADSLRAAEGALQDFKQTLTNTFAELSTGLAVFDQARKLQLFNPALARLIEVPVETLLRRPSLFAMLDAMRDRNMLPEPKDYRSWKQQMVALEAASVRGDYRETWYLPNGKAFRVVGRPYPNGALAFMIDDITDQVTRDRLFRVELDLTLAVMNQMDEAVIAFSATGDLIVANAAYRALWGHDAAVLARDEGPLALLEAWRSQSAPTLAWTEAEAALTGGADMPGEPREIRLLDGRLLLCRGLVLPGGGRGFAFVQAKDIASPALPEAPLALSA